MIDCKFKHMNVIDRQRLFQQIDQLDDFKFMMQHFKCVSTAKQLNNGTYAFVVKERNDKYYDTVIVAYASGYLRGSIFNKIENLIGVRRHWTGKNVQRYHVIAKFDSTDVFEMYKQQFARMRAYVVKHKLV